MACARAARAPHLTSLAAYVVLASTAGCEPEIEPLRWGITFAEGSTLSHEAAAVSARITRESCHSGEELYRFELDAEGRGPDPAALAAGNYGFAAEAYDTQCRPIAFGCITRKFPAQAAAPIEIVLTPSSGAPRCAPEQCNVGRCIGPSSSLDAGSRPVLGQLDAALVAGDPPLDASDESTQPSAYDGSTEAGASDAGSDCPAGGLRRPGGSCYRASYAPGTFFDGRERCSAWNTKATVVVFDDRNEERWVIDMVGGGNTFWVGVTDDDFEGIWFTEHEELALYTHWKVWPSGGRSANCARYNPTDDAWRDRSCFESNPVICELRPAE